MEVALAGFKHLEESAVAPFAATLEQLQASELFCSRCRTAQPVRERLLLVLPDGFEFDVFVRF